MSPSLHERVELPAVLRDAPEVELEPAWAAELDAALADVAAGYTVYTDSDEAFDAELAESSHASASRFEIGPALHQM
jgi:hypothetical protein